MSDDYISRQAAIGEMRDMYHAAEKWGKETSDDVIKARAESCMASLIEMKLRIENLPPVQSDVPERNVGKWIDDCSCSICHWIHEDDKGFALLTNYNFCPNCGADMRKETENERGA